MARGPTMSPAGCDEYAQCPVDQCADQRHNYSNSLPGLKNFLHRGHITMNQDFLADRRKALEESFFRKRNTELLEKLKQQAVLDAKRNELAMVSGIQDEKLLDRLAGLDLGSETVAALSLVPMVRVAWADGHLDDKEREAILKAAVEAGVNESSASYHWLITWLENQPDEDLVNTWMEYTKALCATLDDDARLAIRDGLIRRSREVAEAAGGFLGLTNPISAAEDKVIQEMTAAFDK